MLNYDPQLGVRTLKGGKNERPFSRFLEKRKDFWSFIVFKLFHISATFTYTVEKNEERIDVGSSGRAV